MSKKSDKIILNLLNRLEAEELAKASLECDMLELNQELKRVKENEKSLYSELEQLSNTTHKLMSENMLTKLNEQDCTLFIMMIGVDVSETTESLINYLNRKGFLNANKIKKELGDNV